MEFSTAERDWLPHDLTRLPLLGEGFRCRVHQAVYLGRRTAVKVYRPAVVSRHRKRYGISIAEFEHGRNLAFYHHPELRRYVARPIAYRTSAHGLAEAFVQELLVEPTVGEYHRQHQALPDGFFDELAHVCRLSRAAGLSDLDLTPRNVRVGSRERNHRPILFDFNMIPRHERRTNPLAYLLYRLKILRSDRRDRYWLRTMRDRYTSATAPQGKTARTPQRTPAGSHTPNAG